jgi:hypothetical protein
MIWIAVVVGLAILAWVAFTVAGELYPSRPLAVSSLKRELTIANISPTGFSEECIKELADRIVKLIEFEIEVGTRKGPVNSFIEEDARAVAMLVYNVVIGDDDHYSAGAIKEGVANETANWVWEILAKHDPHRFGLDNLEKTQTINAFQQHAVRSLHDKSSNK